MERHIDTMSIKYKEDHSLWKYEITFHTGDDYQRTVRIKDKTLLKAEAQLFLMYSSMNTTILRTRKINNANTL